MINKKNLWFLTLFSLILVLSVYYITMPSELLLTNGTVAEDNSTIDDSVSISESEILTTLRVESDEELLSELDSLKLVLNDSKSSVDEKNDAFDKMKELNINKSKELELEKIVEDDLKIQTFIKIKGDQIKVIVDKQEHDTALANSIMRVIQDEFDTKKYITVQFKAS
jgi:stage III sporulation protein AH